MYIFNEGSIFESVEFVVPGDVSEGDVMGVEKVDNAVVLNVEDSVYYT